MVTTNVHLNIKTGVNMEVRACHQGASHWVEIGSSVVLYCNSYDAAERLATALEDAK